ncbi:MAG TPA: acyl carrier protein [Acetivibrio sp.]|uniref:acyl carrier protein n=1 Tax=Acetivibrio sp. TaxID=1872092 RepID=UPI002BF262CC|nr:acyl carrier protein [Acetivibrio sp.]HOM01305.1 acyl carrier protein [Acetivibrio sp.]
MEKLIELVSEILNVDKESINLETSRDKTSAWDSLNHIRLVAEVEEQLNIKIPFEKVPDIKKVGDFLDYVKE